MIDDGSTTGVAFICPLISKLELENLLIGQPLHFWGLLNPMVSKLLDRCNSTLQPKLKPKSYTIIKWVSFFPEWLVRLLFFLYAYWLFAFLQLFGFLSLWRSSGRIRFIRDGELEIIKNGSVLFWTLGYQDGSCILKIVITRISWVKVKKKKVKVTTLGRIFK